VKLNDADSVIELAIMMRQEVSVAVEFCAAGSRYELLFCPVAKIAAAAELSWDVDRWVVALINRGGCFHFRLGNAHPAYIQEKLGVAFKDACNFSALLRALDKPIEQITPYLQGLSLCPYDKDSLADGVIPPL
jgi:hypothetical protein